MLEQLLQHQQTGEGQATWFYTVAGGNSPGKAQILLKIFNFWSALPEV